MDANAPMASRGSVYDLCCGRCNTRVMIAPTSQRLLRKSKRIKILCYRCYVILAQHEPVEVRLAAPLEDIERERREAIANPYRVRN